MSEPGLAIRILEEVYARKVKSNPSYSRRAFARDLKVSPSFIANFLKGRRRLSVGRAEELAKALALDKKTSRRFVKSILMESMEAASRGSDLHDLLDDATSVDAHDVDVDQFQFFNGWYHVAVLDLIGCRDFEPSASWISSRLNISAEAAFATVERLKRLGLVRVKGGRLVKTNAHLRVPTGANGASAVVAYHRQMIEKALDELKVTDPMEKERRLVTGLTMSIPSENIAVAKKKIEQFKREMAALLTVGEAEEVVQLNIQLIPLTKRK